jgi:putative FmdB family regulatory protein
MPVYEYRCNACHQIFEYQQRMADAPKTVCESCSGALERIISRSAFQFKGGGWYKDLYASSKPSESSTPASTPSTSTASEAKPASSGSSDSGSSSSSSSSGGSGSSTPAAAGPAK